MDAVAGALGQLVFLLLSMGLMWIALSRRRDGGLFSALPFGLLPATALCLAQFWGMQQTDLPEIQADRAEKVAIVKKLAAEQTPGADPAQLADRAELESVYIQGLDAEPAFKFCMIMVVLAPLAVFMRRRRARLGLALDAEPLSRWSVPWALVWLVLAPVIWFEASRHGVVSGLPWCDHLALNVVTVGAVIFLFQGLVVLGAKMALWYRNPRTRALAGLSLVALTVGLVFADRFGFLQMFVLMLLVTGVLEPWADLRHIHAPAPKGGGA